MAESLAEIHDPLETALGMEAESDAGGVARAIARSLAPLAAAAAPPAWLLPGQVQSFQRVVAALERYGGAMLADPIGSGKTFVALAVAQLLAEGRETVALVPAVLRPQWLTVSVRLGIPIRIVSHEATSRGPPPDSGTRLVIIDESHRYRNPGTRRYGHVAPWLVGRRVLLLTGTPVVNRLHDLAAQLLLAIRDDALAARGSPSLTREFCKGRVPPALGDLVLTRDRPAGTPVARAIDVPVPMVPAAMDLLAGVEALGLSIEPGIAALLRTVLFRALASSPAAFAATLDRYELLLHHARSAAASNRRLDRRAVQLFTAGDREQLLFWELLPDSAGPVELVLEDSAPLSRLIVAAREHTRGDDPKSRTLRELVEDRRATVVFTTSRDTLHWLRSRFGDLRPAWVSGSEAGIGASRLKRDDVLTWFRPGTSRHANGGPGPRLLLATDVAAEGLDLQCAGRVVHFDLPWTTVRLDQRSGRAIRLGSENREVEVVRFLPPLALEARLRQLERLVVKRGLATMGWADPAGRWLYSWRAELAAWAGAGPATAGLTIAHGREPGWLVGLTIDRLERNGASRAAPASLIWIGEDGIVNNLPSEVVPRLVQVSRLESRAPTAAEKKEAVAVVAPVVRERLGIAAGEAWADGGPSTDARALRKRLVELARDAARRRDRRELELLDSAIAWTSGGFTAGEAALLKEARRLPARALLRVVRRLIESPRAAWVPAPRLTGIVRVTDSPLESGSPRRPAGAKAEPPAPRLLSCMPDIRAVLFDLDGTLIDSIELILASYRHTLATHGFPPAPDSEWMRGVGTPLRVQLAPWAESAERLQELVATYREYNLANHDRMISAFPGVVAVVREIRSRGIRTAVVTSKTREGADRGLRHVGLDQAIEIIVAADDVQNPKPHPEPVDRAVAALGVDPGQTLFVGDSIHDLTSGRQAGVLTGAVLWGPFGREELAPAAPDYWLDHPEELRKLLFSRK